MENQSTLDVAIIGAGLTGLTLAWDLATVNASLSGNLKIHVFEKSLGPGGRMATRRSELATFDHGAQFIKKAEISQKWIELWKEAKVLEDFPYGLDVRFCGKSAITDLPKLLAHHATIHYNEKIISLSQHQGLWEIKNEHGLLAKAHLVVMTAPLPQCLDILSTSTLAFNPLLLKIKYAKALVFLVQALESNLNNKLLPNFLYHEEQAENLGEGVFSMCAQHIKGISKIPSWSVVMDSNWSLEHFELSDEDLLKKMSQIFPRLFPGMSSTQFHVGIKKWKYAQPLSTWDSLFESPSANLYLAGDAFGGPSLLGALRSSQGLVHHLKDAF